MGAPPPAVPAGGPPGAGPLRPSSQSAFLGPLLWERTLPCDGGLFQLQYMDLEEFLTENGMGMHTNGPSSATAQIPSQVEHGTAWNRLEPEPHRTTQNHRTTRTTQNQNRTEPEPHRTRTTQNQNHRTTQNQNRTEPHRTTRTTQNLTELLEPHRTRTTEPHRTAQNHTEPHRTRTTEPHRTTQNHTETHRTAQNQNPTEPYRTTQNQNPKEPEPHRTTQTT